MIASAPELETPLERSFSAAGSRLDTTLSVLRRACLSRPQIPLGELVLPRELGTKVGYEGFKAIERRIGAVSQINLGFTENEPSLGIAVLPSGMRRHRLVEGSQTIELWNQYTQSKPEEAPFGLTPLMTKLSVERTGALVVFHQFGSSETNLEVTFITAHEAADPRMHYHPPIAWREELKRIDQEIIQSSFDLYLGSLQK